MQLVDYARLAARAYSEKPTFGEADSSARAVVFPGNIVGFPGTNNLACWLADLEASTTLVPGLGTLHEGFWESTEALLEGLFGLDEIDVLVGHSEGAAIALLAGAQLCFIGRPPKAIYAFEPPRVTTDDTLAQIFKEAGITLVLTQKGEDIVPMVPRIYADWQHPGPLTHIGKPLLPFPNVEDHLIENVIAALE